ncbi:MAG TPA: MaoC family dehydratase N-terminal domain-containing protein [Rhizomicrobium sp.]|jgi:acyl dehydratase
MLDKSFIGLETKPRSVDVEKGQLKFFARATGEKNPIYFDEAAAKTAGHPALPAPPTFLFCLETMAPAHDGVMARLGIDIGRVLHGEQQFTYGKPIYAGDTITMTTKVSDIYDKKGGALDFVVQDTHSVNQRGENVGVSRTIIVVRNG